MKDLYMSVPTILFLTPYLDEKIWGGARLAAYGYKLTSSHVGEALIVSALPNKSSNIVNPEVSEKNLFEFYTNQPAFFGNKTGVYPLLTKLIDANDNLSIQVHPDDAYCFKRHHKLGKTECWYILDAKPNSKLVYGLNCQSIDEVKTAIENQTLEQKLNYIDVKSGDVIYVPAGTVHAITAGLLIYELQQNSDVTYRLYDYNRLENGISRELMVEDSLNVIKLTTPKCPTTKDALIDCEYFKLIKREIVNVAQQLLIPEALWLEVTVIDGHGTVDGHLITKGSVFLVGHNQRVIISGCLTILIAYLTK